MTTKPRSMTKADILARLNEIGERFVGAGSGDDMKGFRERGLALGVACGVVAALPDDYIDAALRGCERSLATARAKLS